MGPRSIEQACADIKRWKQNGGVGCLTLFSAPKSHSVDIIGEETIKLFEMDEEHKRAVFRLFDLFDAEKIELFRGKDGLPDRVKVTRRY